MSSTMTCILNTDIFTMKPIPHNPSLMHTNIIQGIWTVKVFYKTEDCMGNPPYEVQIFRSDNNVNDTPFPYRTFLNDISEVAQFVEKFKNWADKKSYISFSDLKFYNNIAVVTRRNPVNSEYTATLQITKSPAGEYYNISFDRGVDTQGLRRLCCYCEKDDITHYMRWFTQWADHFHECDSVAIVSDPYMKWIESWMQL